ncbi:protein Tob2-like [Homarus americanus]|uniref:BTG2-like n=1 Tax=Homarus americanus TaxID=6706 RepID=A0A8J5MV24_HOMAM|nr:protein Tob2-like [Homarus americanus]KAG7164074.1 BTG2-like [Homarus americanus]
MRLEIKSAANFLVDLARLNNSGLTEKQLEKFRGNVCDILLRHYTDHWFPDKPFKGSGYRCIRINGNLDPLIARAGFMMGLAVSFLRSLFPKELTMWVDPMEVAYRIGENGSICVLYEELPPPPRKSTPPPPAEIKTPVKAMSQPPPQQTSSPPPALPPHHHIHQQQISHHHHHHFSPSKSVVVSSPLHLSPPLSPITTQQQQQAAATAMQLSMFIMGGGGKDGSSLVKCKESLRGGLEARSLQMDRLFVSS